MRKILKHRGARIVLELGLFLMLYLGVRAYMQWHLASGTLPVISAETLAGKPFDTRQARKGPLLVQFWATWCPICHLEDKSIQAISRDYPVISIALSSGDAPAVRKFMRQHGLDFPVINDPNGEIARRFGVTNVPVSFVVNSRNRIRFVERGYTTGWGLRLRLWLSR